MANTIKSALFVDYDSFDRSLKAAKDDVAELLAQRSAALVAAIESGALVTPALEEGSRRRSLIRRCYADPELLGNNRAALIAAGFEVIDCPTLEGWERNSAAVHIALDTIEALGHPTGYEEFILLSADADMTPMLLRLRAHNRTTVIFANDVTAASYKAIADGMIEQEPFLALLDGEEIAPVEEEPEPAAAAPVGDRSGLEALARKIHGATNVPMFSPRTFADLFRILAQEVGENGYHFQQTAENVTEKLIEAGRNVNRRQVLFVVKGLALKGHVFSTTDTPERLAEVFRDQVLYLAGSAGIEVTEEETALLPAWIVGRSAAPPPPKPAATPPAKPKTPPEPEKKSLLRRRPARPVTTKAAAEEEEPPASEAAAKKAKAEPESGPEPKKPTPSSGSSHLRRLAELRAGNASRTPGRLAALRSGKADDKEKAGAASPEPAPRSAAKSATKKPDEPKDELENSILAAIAEAVDVLVEDGGSAKDKDAEEAGEEIEVDIEAEIGEIVEAEADTAAIAEGPPPEAEPSEGGDSDDIGDEIQRIIASYSKARQQN
ncbi:MAG: NYN domain-containing protein [Bauldia sp.]|uniref:NYN domain-containing protein n=1 Tax=Bauldia sp. TaxID=2575872 RepID=UPI001D59268A|nr:NYN domain-containing protein [Bauldia sp.]MCB1496189.1 NYN domain-containing protein [Bauldia sp.]